MDCASIKAPAPLPAKSCAICTTLRGILARDDFTADLSSSVEVSRDENGIAINVGPITQVIAQPCPGHDQLLQYLYDDFKKKPDQKTGEFYLALTSTFLTKTTKPWHKQNHLIRHRPGDPCAQIMIGNKTDTAYVWTMVSARERSEQQSHGCARILDRDWADLELIKGWKKKCLGNHGTKCSNPLKINPVAPDWLVDTHTESLVPGAGISEYVAVSYRWGTAASFLTTSDMLTTLTEPGALSLDRLGGKTPTIVRQAMKLVKAIDERYLWVDTICIVHDDEAQSTNQLQLMGAIYASAQLVLIAADGDSSTGFPGFKGMSSPRQFDQIIIPVLDNQKILLRHPHIFGRNPTNHLEYFERAWTFQEFFLSKRRLILARGQLYWTCACASWNEEDIASDDTTGQRDLVDKELSRIFKGLPDFWALTRLIFNYMGRKLTFREDALPGITGLLALVSSSFRGGFLYGLPEMSFDSALMWRASTSWSKLTRRQNSGKSNLLGLSHPLPSWSWISWEGKCGTFMQEFTFESWHRENGNDVKPITQWYTHETSQNTGKRLIQSTWHNIEEALNGSPLELSPGWTRELYEKSKDRQIIDKWARPHQEGPGQYVYSHHLFPDEYFWFPVPIQKVDESIHPWNPLQTPYISCETRRGWFSSMEISPSYFDGPESLYYNDYTFVAILLDNFGHWCGKLHLHDADEFSEFLKADPDGEAKVELVATCKMKQKARSFTKPLVRATEGGGEEDSEAEPPIYKDVYGVLWVEWVDGVAYRKASGFVEKDAWERHDLEDVHLVMG